MSNQAVNIWHYFSRCHYRSFRPFYTYLPTYLPRARFYELAASAFLDRSVRESTLSSRSFFVLLTSDPRVYFDRSVLLRTGIQVRARLEVKPAGKQLGVAPTRIAARLNEFRRL